MDEPVRHAGCNTKPLEMFALSKRLTESYTPTPVPTPASVPTSAGFASGTILQGTYRIVSSLAEGGFGEVYLAAHTRLPGRYAVKVLHRNLVRNGEALTRFRQEAEITSTLRHPHIVQVFDFNVAPSGVPYLVMELLEGQLLTHRILEAGALDPRTAIAIVAQIAQALHAAHARGVVHRDLKPDNVMLLASDGMRDFVKVMDFGISHASWRPQLGDPDHIAGTPQYMAPEQACGQRDQIDHRSDQFSLAAIAYTMLTGREPFWGEDMVAILHQVVHFDPPPPSQLLPALTPEIDAVIMRGLAKQSDDRYPNTLAFATALRAAIEGVAAEPPEITSVTPAPVSVTSDFTPPPQSEAKTVSMVTGHVTERLIRRTRRKIYKVPRRLAMAALVGAALFLWFSPATRGPTRAAVQRAASHVQPLLGRLAAALHVR
jgi:serine/threonine protein kinase